jgi:aconitate hydratase
LGKKFTLEEPKGECLPAKGFDPGEDLYQAASFKGEVVVDPESERLQLLTPFDPWSGKDLEDMVVLIKVMSFKKRKIINSAQFQGKREMHNGSY